VSGLGGLAPDVLTIVAGVVWRCRRWCAGSVRLVKMLTGREREGPDGKCSPLDVVSRGEVAVDADGDVRAVGAGV
jgi:hypothetical protein